MEPAIYTPTYELFLVLEPLRATFSDAVTTMESFESADAPELLGADAYYRSATDVALLALRFDERTLSHRQLSWVLEMAAGAGLPALDPARLDELDRRNFYQSYLAGYELRVEDTATPSAAILELGRRLGLTSGRPATTEEPKRLPTTPLSGSISPSRRRLGSGSNVMRRRLDSEPPAPAVHDSSRQAAPARRAEKSTASSAQLDDGSTQPRARRPRTTIPAIAVRMLRCGRWVTARVGALSTKGAYIVTGGLPHRGEIVHLALGFNDVGAMIEGRVSHVTTVEDAAETGLSGFAVKFDTRTPSPARAHLVTLLRAARDAGVKITPPPPRRGVRFPVCWPVRVGTPRHGFEASCLDVSSDGLFVATPQSLDTPIVFRLPLDNGERAVHGRAEVARSVSEAMAEERGLPNGYGLRILELSPSDRRRYEAFLARVRLRTEKRVVVGASPRRCEALTQGLASAGYTVFGGSDAQTLIDLAEQSARPPDLVIIDSSLAALGLSREWVEQVFSTRRVPCVTTDHHEPARARLAADQILSIAA